jgi:hypothetical protein
VSSIGVILCWSIGRVEVHYVVSVLLLIPAGGALDEAPNGPLDSVQLAPCRGVCDAIVWSCGKAETGDNEKKWEVLKNILIAFS